MVSSTQTVQENGGSVMVCVDSGIQGSVDLGLLATLSSRIGKASKYYIYILHVISSICPPYTLIVIFGTFYFSKCRL